MAKLLTLPIARLMDASGTIYAGGKLFAYATGTTTPASVYTTDALNVAHPSPVVADSGGLLPAIFLDPAVTYRFVATTSAGAAISGMDFDPVGVEFSGEVSFLPSGPGAVTRTVQNKLRDFVNVLDYYEATDPDFTNAFERVIYQALPGDEQICIDVPVGEFILSRQIIPRRQIFLRGAGTSASKLRFVNVASINATMQGAISLGILATLNAYTTNPSGYTTAQTSNWSSGGADFSTISDIAIEIAGTRPAGFDYAIWNGARGNFRNVTVMSSGFRARGGNNQLGAGTIAANTNQSTFSDCTSFYASEHAFFCDGEDTNAMLFNRCNAFQPVGNGFYEASFLGNSYVGCHVDGGATGYKAVSSGGTNCSVFLGCYQEGNATVLWDLVSSCIILSPLGTVPVALSGARNPTFKGLYTIGSFMNRPMVIADSEAVAYSLGDAANPAIQIYNSGFRLRGGDNSLGGLERGGSGTFLTRNGAAVMKVELGAAITDAVAAAGVPTQADFNALVTQFNLVLARMRAGTPNISP